MKKLCIYCKINCTVNKNLHLQLKKIEITIMCVSRYVNFYSLINNDKFYEEINLNMSK